MNCIKKRQTGFFLKKVMISTYHEIAGVKPYGL
jgi:hypothetical protein